jgi:hypothetical protein
MKKTNQKSGDSTRNVENLAHRNGTITKIRQPFDHVGQLENRNYLLCFDPNAGEFYLEDYHEFSLPTKIYGDNVDSLTERCLTTFNRLNRNTGLLLSGLKGTGKSVQLKHLAVNSGMPVIIINSAFSGTMLLQFFEKLPNSCVILFDEFEKVYQREEEQYTILPLLDGMSTVPHIYVFTINGTVNEFMLGRPGRIRYVKKYSRLEDSVVSAIVKDMLNDQTKAPQIESFVGMMPQLNMDLLTSIITEVNIYPELDFGDLVSVFNIEDPLAAKYCIFHSFPVLVTNKKSEERVAAWLREICSDEIMDKLKRNVPGLFDSVVNRLVSADDEDDEMGFNKSDDEESALSYREIITNFMVKRLKFFMKEEDRISYHKTLAALLEIVQPPADITTKDVLYKDVFSNNLRATINEQNFSFHSNCVPIIYKTSDLEESGIRGSHLSYDELMVIDPFIIISSGFYGNKARYAFRADNFKIYLTSEEEKVAFLHKDEPYKHSGGVNFLGI